MEIKNRKKAAETAESRMAMIAPLLAPNLSREDVTNLEEISLKLPESLSDLNSQFQAWLGECCHGKIHSALGTTPGIAFERDSMPDNFPDAALVARAFPHCEQRKADKSGCVSFRGDKYDMGVRFVGTRADVVYDAGNTETLTIEAPGERPFHVHKLQIQEHVAPRARKRNIDRIPADSFRLLDAACAELSGKTRSGAPPSLTATARRRTRRNVRGIF